MRLKIVVIIILVFSLAFAGGAYFFYCYNKPVCLSCQKNKLEKRQIVVGKNKLLVEIADTGSKRSVGLGGREKMSSDEGMLFIFPSVGRYGFWMKDTLIPLDFIYIRNLQVVELKENVAVTQVPIPFYSSESVDMVLEVNEGYISSNNIKIGDMVSY